MELDHNHSCTLHGERSELVYCVEEFGNTVVDDTWQMLIVGLSRSQGGVQFGLKAACTCLCPRAALSSPWWSISPWPITRCMSTQTGPSVWAGVWPCPPWSASQWWWSSRSYSLRDPWSRWATTTLQSEMKYHSHICTLGLGGKWARCFPCIQFLAKIS